MTEDEAKTKHCPFVHGFAVPVKDQVPACAPKCIGSACMMWQVRSVTAPADPPAMVRMIEDGHCGLLRQVW